jgi:predicted DNA binding CopG/RHH family protein
MANKKVKMDVKPKATSTPTNLNEGDGQGTNVEESPVPGTSTSTPGPTAGETVKEKPARASKKVAQKQAVALVEAQPVPSPDEPAKEQASEKAVKMKRLTLDISKPLHKAIKAKAVEEGISIVDMLRALLKQHYGK